MSALRSQLVVVTVIAAVAEVLLLRIALRLGPVLPNQADVLPLFAVVERLGVVALNVGVLAGSTLLGLASVEAIHRGPKWTPFGLALFGAVGVNLGLPTLVGRLTDGSAEIVHGVVTGAAVLLTVLGASQAPRVRAVLMLVGLAHLFALAQAVSQNGNWIGGVGSSSGSPIVVAETVAVVVALALPWLLQVRPRPREILIGAAAGLCVAGAATVQPWGLATVAIWTLAFSLFLPPALYGAAIMSVLVTVQALRRQPRGHELVMGLVLVCLAGLKLDVSSNTLMALTGLVIASNASDTRPMEVSRSHSRAIDWSITGLRGSPS